MQKRTSPLKFGDLAEKSGLNSVSNLSAKVPISLPRGPPRDDHAGGDARGALRRDGLPIQISSDLFSRKKGNFKSLKL